VALVSLPLAISHYRHVAVADCGKLKVTVITWSPTPYCSYQVQCRAAIQFQNTTGRNAHRRKWWHF